MRDSAWRWQVACFTVFDGLNGRDFVLLAGRALCRTAGGCLLIIYSKINISMALRLQPKNQVQVVVNQTEFFSPCQLFDGYTRM